MARTLDQHIQAAFGHLGMQMLIAQAQLEQANEELEATQKALAEARAEIELLKSGHQAKTQTGK